MDPTPIVHGTLLGLVVLLIAHRPWTRGPLGDLSALWASLGLGLAFLIGWRALNGWPPLKPARPDHWLVYLLPAAVLVSAAERRLLAWPLVWILRGALSGVFLWATFGPVAADQEWEGGTRSLAAGLLVVSALWTLGVVACLARRAGDEAALERDQRGAGLSVPFVLMVWGGVSAAVLGSTSSVSALTVGAMNTFFGITCALALLRPERAYWRGITAPFAFAVWALLFVATYYGSLELLPSLLVLGAPALALLPLGSLAGMRAALVRAVLVGAVGGVAIWLSMPEPNPYGY